MTRATASRARVFRFHRPLARYFRRRRLQAFRDRFRVGPQTRVLDVGGYAYYWSFLDEPPAVTILNIEPPVEGTGSFDWVVADAARLPFRDNAFEIVFSNSLLEHIADDGAREAFAAEARRVGRHYCVQTPNRWFPVEPHLLTPFIHYLPARLQRKLVRNFTVWGWLTRPSAAEAAGFLDLTRLLDRAEMRKLFPQASILRERFLGMTKSFIAVDSSEK